MHIIRLDIDRKNSAEHLSVGPLGGGLNAIYAPVSAAGEDLARFVRCLLFRGYSARQPDDEEFTQTVDGSMQWVDASGHVRMMSYAGGSPALPSRYVHSPIHPSERPIHAEDREHIRGLGNIFWEGDERDGRWDELRGDILGMVYCSPIGSVSPEKLWWAASRLGVHASARSELDEGYQRLKAEEQDLLERLRHVENVDHDRAWWSIERDRLSAELSHVQRAYQQSVPSTVSDNGPNVTALKERLASIQIEISKLRSQIQELVIGEANAKLEPNRRDDHRMTFGSLSNGTPKAFAGRIDYTGERQRLQLRIEHLIAEQSSVEIQLRNTPSHANAFPVEPTNRWDDAQLKQQYAHAEEMLRRWDRRAQAHRRLAEVQSHLRTRSPFRKTTDGSLIPAAERYLRELTSGAARMLPPWAVEASYLHQLDQFPEAHNAASHGYRNEYYDRIVPGENTRQRKLVDLAIRLAIAEAAVPRVGRIPILLDDSIGGFRGESLEQILHVLAAFSRDGRQLLVSTKDEFTARRIAAHGGTVSRMQEILRYAQPSFVLDGQNEIGLHPSMDRSALLIANQPLRVYGGLERRYELGEINRQLAGLANEQANHSWWYPEQANRYNSLRNTNAPVSSAPMHNTPMHHAAVPNESARKYYLHVDSNVQDAPGVDADLAERLQSAGIYRVGDLLNSHTAQLGAAIRVEGSVLEHIQRVSEMMCGTPQLRAFDAQVLVGCGIRRSSQLRELQASELVERAESYLASVPGQDLVRRASAFEVSRIHSWLADMKRSLNRRTRTAVPYEDRSRGRDRDWDSSRSPRSSRSEYESRPRIARLEPNEHDDSKSDRNTARRNTSSTRTQSTSSSQRSERNGTVNSTNSSSKWKFYLDIESPVVDAPSIGPRMAERLSPLGIITVGDLISSDAAEVATQLADKNVTSEIVTQWQQQALLVCRIPNLRGHDAQLLVGAGFVTAEQVAAADSSVVFEKVVRFSSSKAGVRILRGSNAPDVAEVSDWIQWSQNCRAVRAA